MNNAMYFETLDRLQQAFEEFSMGHARKNRGTGDVRGKGT